MQVKPCQHLLGLFTLSLILKSTQGIFFGPLVNNGSQHIHFFLYPDLSDPWKFNEIKLNDLYSLQNSGYQSGANCITIFLVHGFFSNYLLMYNLKDAYRRSGLPVNIIIVEWSKLSFPRFPLDIIDIPGIYIETTDNVVTVGHKMAKFVKFLISIGATELSRIHFVGHSLGAHASGYAGRELKAFFGQPVWRISALEPAAPLFDAPIATKRKVTKEDAFFVDVIHTNMDNFGSKEQLGHVDFYVNGGFSQPGCNFFSNLAFCSHTYAVLIYVASFYKIFPACSCPLAGTGSTSPATLQHCELQCSNPTLVGVYTPVTARGKYYVKGPDFWELARYSYPEFIDLLTHIFPKGGSLE